MAHAQRYTQEIAGSFLQFFAVFCCFSFVAGKFQSLGSAVFRCFFAVFCRFSLFSVRAIQRVPLSALLLLVR